MTIQVRIILSLLKALPMNHTRHLTADKQGYCRHHRRLVAILLPGTCSTIITQRKILTTMITTATRTVDLLLLIMAILLIPEPAVEGTLLLPILQKIIHLPIVRLYTITVAHPAGDVEAQHPTQCTPLQSPCHSTATTVLRRPAIRILAGAAVALRTTTIFIITLTTPVVTAPVELITISPIVLPL